MTIAVGSGVGIGVGDAVTNGVASDDAVVIAVGDGLSHKTTEIIMPIKEAIKPIYDKESFLFLPKSLKTHSNAKDTDKNKVSITNIPMPMPMPLITKNLLINL